MATPFGTWGGLPGAGGPGVSLALQNKGYSQEEDILKLLPQMSPVDQVMLDIKLNMNGIDAFPGSGHLLVSNSKEKLGLIPIFRGRVKNPNTIRYFIKVVNDSIRTHQGREDNQLTGSDRWNATWIKVYHKWLRILYKLLGELNGTQNGG
jgi:hypothetical protein